MAVATALILSAQTWAGGAPPAGETQRQAQAAFLFVYRPKPGAEALFEQAYRRHLDWHRRNGDPLPWYAWYVTAGPRVGLFVDGTFGIPFGALDRRVRPAEDAADLAETAGAFGDPVDRRLYRLRPELSTATPIESGAPDPSVDVLEIVVTPGAERAFEGALASARNAWQRRPDRLAYTSYQLVTGGELPAYLILLGRTGWALYDRGEGSAWDLVLGESLDGERRSDRLRGVVREVRSETWTYRPDLTLRQGEATTQ
ncbi:MAG TPA: hypothetical protein VF198_05220 [Vicinamibacterales bacterium]